MSPDQQHQTTLISALEQQQQLEAAVEIYLKALRTWTRLPTDRVDWELETLLDQLSGACLALRRLRSDEELPF